MTSTPTAPGVIRQADVHHEPAEPARRGVLSLPAVRCAGMGAPGERDVL